MSEPSALNSEALENSLLAALNKGYSSSTPPAAPATDPAVPASAGAGARDANASNPPQRYEPVTADPLTAALERATNIIR